LLALLFIIPLRTDVFRANMDSASLNPLVAEEFENNRKAIENSIGGVESVSEDTPVVSIPEGSSVATPAESVSDGEVSQTPVETSNYRIITGSFKSEENAMDHVNILKADGFEPVIIRADNGFFRVNAMTCTSITTALSKMDSISKKFPGSWISKR